MKLVLFLCFFTILGFGFNIIAHEIGHFLAGLVTGWRIVSIQILHIAIMKSMKNGSLRIVKLPFPACQCIMYPKSPAQSFVLYTLGGIIMNAVLTLVFMYGAVSIPIGEITWIFSFCFFGSGISMLLLNGIPSTKRVCNDMACFLFCRNDESTHYYHNIQLMVARQLSQGLSYRDCDLPVMKAKKADNMNDIMAYQMVLEFYYFLDLDRYHRAKRSLEKIKMNQYISLGVRKIILLETLYLGLLMDIVNKDTSVMQKNNDNYEINSYIKNYETVGDVHTARVKALNQAYYFYESGDMPGGILCLDKAISEIQEMKCLYSGEKSFCIDQLLGIRNILQRDSMMMG